MKIISSTRPILWCFATKINGQRAGLSFGDQHRRSAWAVAALPRPKQAKAAAVPADDGFGFYDDQRVPPVVPCSCKPDPQQAIGSRESGSARARTFQDVKLVR